MNIQIYSNIPNLWIGENLQKILKDHTVLVELLTMDEAADFFGYCDEHLREAIEEGFIHTSIIDGVEYAHVMVIDPKKNL